MRLAFGIADQFETVGDFFVNLSFMGWMQAIDKRTKDNVGDQHGYRQDEGVDRASQAADGPDCG